MSFVCRLLRLGCCREELVLPGHKLVDVFSNGLHCHVVTLSSCWSMSLIYRFLNDCLPEQNGVWQCPKRLLNRGVQKLSFNLPLTCGQFSTHSLSAKMFLMWRLTSLFSLSTMTFSSVEYIGIVLWCRTPVSVAKMEFLAHELGSFIMMIARGVPNDKIWSVAIARLSQQSP